MRTSFSVALLLTMLLAGTYWFTTVSAVCSVPVYYHLGDLDKRFGLTENDVKSILSEAESVWEEATGRNLFTYEAGRGMAINFIFDERQQIANEAELKKEELDKVADNNESIESTYAELVSRYDEKVATYEEQKQKYETKLKAYNQEVDKYNKQGGAPAEEYERLENQRSSLDRELLDLNQVAREINQLSSKINDLGQKGNELIRQYNEKVSRFNDSYAHGEEFTQGDYQGDSINIYTFKDRQELRLVLAHEFGHSLTIDHVEDPTSVMHYLIDQQPEAIKLTRDDLDAFEVVCGYDSLYEKLRQQLIAILKSYGVL